MKAIVESKYYIRERPITSYWSFPVYSDNIERTLCSRLDFLNQYDNFELSLTIIKNKS